MARDLISKILAAGLSAGLFLIWWPERHATAGLTSLVVRGALWTLTYELLLLAFTPLERLARRAVSARAHHLRPRSPFVAVPAPARVGGACVLACAGAAPPLTLLAGAQAPRPQRPAATAGPPGAGPRGGAGDDKGRRRGKAPGRQGGRRARAGPGARRGGPSLAAGDRPRGCPPRRAAHPAGEQDEARHAHAGGAGRD